MGVEGDDDVGCDRAEELMNTQDEVITLRWRRPGVLRQMEGGRTIRTTLS